MLEPLLANGETSRLFVERGGAELLLKLYKLPRLTVRRCFKVVVFSHVLQVCGSSRCLTCRTDLKEHAMFLARTLDVSTQAASMLGISIVSPGWHQSSSRIADANMVLSACCCVQTVFNFSSASHSLLSVFRALSGAHGTAIAAKSKETVAQQLSVLLPMAEEIGAVCVPELPAEKRDPYTKQVLVVQGLVALTSAVARNVITMLPQVRRRHLHTLELALLFTAISKCRQRVPVLQNGAVMDSATPPLVGVYDGPKYYAIALHTIVDMVVHSESGLHLQLLEGSAFVLS